MMAVKTKDIFTVGRRKTAVAKVILRSKGTGALTVNGKEPKDHFLRPVLMKKLERPFVVTDSVDKFPIRIMVSGGGISAQAGACVHGIARALAKVDPKNQNIVWSGGANSIEEAYLLKSIDSGENWQQWNRIVNDVSVSKTVAIHPDDSDIVYVGLESFILKTTNGGQTWDTIFEFEGRFFFGIAINPVTPSRIYAASWVTTDTPQSLIVYISDDGGSTWREAVEDMP